MTFANSVRIGPVEQITKRSPFEDGHPCAPPMLPTIMTKMAALTKRLQIAKPVVAGVMIEVGRRQHHPHLLEGCVITIIRPIDHLASVIPPKLTFRIEPAAIAEMMDDLAMGAPAILTATAGAIETHHCAQLVPVDRIIRVRLHKGTESPTGILVRA